jgi:multiple sugar transport system substrate-binding protein
VKSRSTAMWSGASAILLAGGLFSAGFTWPSSVRPHAATNKVVHLVYWNMWSGKWAQVIQNQVNDFNRTHPDIQVQMLSVPSADGDTKLLTAIAAGDPPDVFTEWNPTIGQFAFTKSILPLNQFMTGPYKNMLSWFYPVTLKFATYQGKLWAMPLTMNSFALYYNKTMLAQAGISKPPTTIAQLDADQAKEWKFNSSGGVEQIGFYPNPGEDVFDILGNSFNYNMIQNGKYNLLQPNIVKEMDWIASYRKYNYAKVTGFLSAFNGQAGSSEDAFDVGKAGFWVSGMWEMGQIKLADPSLQYGVVPFPAPPGGRYGGSWINGNYNIIPRGAKHPVQAFEFMAWMAGYHNANWAGANDPVGDWIPVSPQVEQTAAYQRFLHGNRLRRVFANLLANPNDNVTPLSPVEEEYEVKMATAMQNVLTSKQSPRQALASVQSVINAQLASDLKNGG